jgi:hypothetical protein
LPHANVSRVLDRIWQRPGQHSGELKIFGTVAALPQAIGSLALHRLRGISGPEIIRNMQQSRTDTPSEVARYLALAEECRGHASMARHTPDEKAWLALAEEWQMLAQYGSYRASTRGATD